MVASKKEMDKKEIRFKDLYVDKAVIFNGYDGQQYDAIVREHCKTRNFFTVEYTVFFRKIGYQPVTAFIHHDNIDRLTVR